MKYFIKCIFSLPTALLYSIITMGLTQQVSGQHVQWASEVIEVSSELFPSSAEQILHRPNVLPNFFDSPNAWSPASPYKNEFIKVGFEQPMKIQQIVIAESFNPGAILEVLIYDKLGHEYKVHSFTQKNIQLPGRLLNLFFEMTSFEVAALKLILNGKIIGTHYGIDAIGVSDSALPVNVDVDKAANLRVDVVVEKLSPGVNSEYNELSPILSPDGKTLYFSRRNHPDNIGGEYDYEDIWYSEYDEDNSEWGSAQNLGSPLNNTSPNYINSISKSSELDGYIALLGNQYKKNTNRMKPGVSIAKKNKDGWHAPENLNIKNYYNKSPNPSFSLSEDGKILVMAIQRKDSKGKKDIYVSFDLGNNQWSEPLNLGNVINTADEEQTPFLADDNKTLYFSSKGYSSYGGYDIFITHRLDDTWKNWTEPKNLGNIINSPEDDLFFNIPPNSAYGYFCRGKEEENLDIFRVTLPIFEPDEEEQKPLLLVNIDSIAPTLVAQVNLKEMKEAEPVVKEPLIVFFDFDKSTLNSQSFDHLEKIKKLLDKNKNLKAEISGHTDEVGTDNYNLQLSQKRVNSVMAYLLNEGIEKERFFVSFHGKSKPISSEDKSKNRRVEIRVIKE
jgi:OmpA-OmpF porin, OOP family